MWAKDVELKTQMKRCKKARQKRRRLKKATKKAKQYRRAKERRRYRWIHFCTKNLGHWYESYLIISQAKQRRIDLLEQEVKEIKEVKEEER